MNNKMTWSNHVDYVVSRANRMLGFIISEAKNLSRDSLLCCTKALYKSLLLSMANRPGFYTVEEMLKKLKRDEQHELFSNREGQEMEYSVRLQTLKWYTLFF